MEKIASTIFDNIQQTFKDNPNLSTALMAGGGAGALGGLLLTTSDDPDESTTSRVMRRIKNSLLGAGMGAGAAGLLSTGVEKMKTVNPPDRVNPITAAQYSPTTRAVGGVVGGAAGLSIARKVRNAKANDTLSMVVNSLSKKVSKPGGKDLKFTPLNPSNFKGLHNPRAALDMLMHGAVNGDKAMTQQLLSDFGSPEALRKALSQAGVTSTDLNAAIRSSSKPPGKIMSKILSNGVYQKVTNSLPVRMLNKVPVARYGRILAGGALGTGLGLGLPEAIGVGKQIGSTLAEAGGGEPTIE